MSDHREDHADRHQKGGPDDLTAYLDVLYGSDTPWTVDHDADAFSLLDLGKLGVGVTSVVATLQAQVGGTRTISDGSFQTALQVSPINTFNTTAGGSQRFFNCSSTTTATANMANLLGMDFASTKAGSGTLTLGIAARAVLKPSAGTTSTAVGGRFQVDTNIGTSTLAIGLDVDVTETFGGTNTTAIGLRIGVGLGLAGTTAWAMQVADVQSYHHGKLSLGGTTAPAYGLDLLGTAQDRGVIRLAESSATPTNPASSTGVLLYHKADKLVAAFNNAGTMLYWTLDLTAGANQSWVRNTTAP